MDYDSDINNKSDFNNFKNTVSQLSAEQKIELIKDISKQLETPINGGVQIIVHADLVMQINSEQSSLDELFLNAANLIAKRRRYNEELQPPTQI